MRCKADVGEQFFEVQDVPHVADGGGFVSTEQLGDVDHVAQVGRLVFRHGTDRRTDRQTDGQTDGR